MPIGAVLGAVGAIGGGLIQAGAARRATNAQVAAGNAQIDAQERATAQTRADLEPWRTGGGAAQAALLYNLGLGPRPMTGGVAPTIEEVAGAAAGASAGGAAGATRFRVNGQMFDTREAAQAYANANLTGGTEYGGFTATPGYEFRLKQGTDAIESSAAARGGLYSGAAMRDLNRFGQDYASNEFNNYMSNLFNVSGSGQNAAAMQGTATMQGAANVGNSLGAIGNAQAAGAIGQGNAIAGGINNLAGLWGYQQGLGNNQGGGGNQGGGINGNGAGFNWLFGGRGLGGFV